MTNRSILCPVDFSPASLSAVEMAVGEAKLRGAVLDLMHVWQPGVEYVGEGPPIPFATEVPRRRIEDDLAGLGADLPRERVRFHVSSQDPSEDIVDFATRLHSDLIVMGTHAHRGIRHWFVGSVCQNVLRHSPCPVLICRGPEKS